MALPIWQRKSAVKNRTNLLSVLFIFAAAAVNTFAVWETQPSPDGRITAIAPGGTAYRGSDGRMVSIPSGWEKKQGADGRLIAIPPEGRYKRGSDGRTVAIPKGWDYKAGRDGRGIALPPEATTVSGRDKRLVAVPKDWTSVEGMDGRAVAVPPGGIAEASYDNRMVAVPKGWTTATGQDGRKVAIPPGGEFIVGPDRYATLRPPDNFDLTDYITLYCVLEPQSETLVEEEADAAEAAADEEAVRESEGQ